MLKRVMARVGFVALAFFLAASWPQETERPPQKTPPLDPPLPPQEYPAKKPKYDYLSSFFSRNTKPLGLKEDLAVKKLLREPSIKWALRAGQRNILD